VVPDRLASLSRDREGRRAFHQVRGDTTPLGGYSTEMSDAHAKFAGRPSRTITISHALSRPRAVNTILLPVRWLKIM
jgi:hypothetical protein